MKFTTQVKNQVTKRALAGENQRQLAKRYGMSVAYVQLLVRNARQSEQKTTTVDVAMFARLNEAEAVNKRLYEIIGRHCVKTGLLT